MLIGDTYHICQYGNQHSVVITGLLDLNGVANVLYQRIHRGMANGDHIVSSVTDFLTDYHTNYAVVKRKYLKDQIERQERTVKQNRIGLDKMRRDLSNVREE